jgi:hypothetical protein
MSKHRRRVDSLKTPLTFAQRYGFLIFGTFASALLLGGLLLGWMAFHERRKMVALERSGGAMEASPKPPSEINAPKPTGTANGLVLAQAFTQAARESTPGAGVKEPSSGWQLITPANAAERLREAQVLLAKFWDAPTWEDKLDHVRDAPRVTPLLREFYTSTPQHEPRAGSFKGSATYRVGPNEIEHLVYEGAKDGSPLEIAMVRDGSNALKLDWESYVGAGEMPWATFLKQRPDKPVLLRALATTDDYFNYEFNDPARFHCVKLIDRSLEHTIYAYAEKGGRLHEDLKEKLTQGAMVPITIRVAYSSSTQSTNCVRLIEVVADRWLLLDAPR